MRVHDRRNLAPVTRSASWWRSPVKVSDCQSIDETSVSKILSRWTLRGRSARGAALDAAADMAIRFIVRAPPDRRGRARRFAAAGRGHCARSKTKRGSPTASRPNRVGADVILAQKFLYFSEQIHLSYPYRLMQLGCSLPSQRNSYLSRHFLSLLRRLMVIRSSRSSLSAYVPSAARISPVCRGCSGATPPTSSSSSGAAFPSG